MKKTKKINVLVIYSFVFFFIITISLVLVIKYTLKPRPLRIMNPSVFTQQDKIATGFYPRLLANLNERSLIIIGRSKKPKFDQSIWIHFLKQLETNGFQLQIFKTDKNLLPAINTFEIVKQDKINDWVIDNYNTNTKIKKILFTFQEYSDLSMHSELMLNLKKIKPNVLSFSESFYSLNPKKREALKLACKKNQSLNSRTWCQAYELTKKHFRSKINWNYLSAALLQYSVFDFFLFIDPVDRQDYELSK